MSLIPPATKVVVCTGPGGVGKTTTAAALGLAAARDGRRAMVLTVDPARRLADALGTQLGPDPTRVDLGHADGGGELWAAMLEPAHTFDGLVREHAATPQQAEDVLANAFYQRLSRSLGATHEYMATEALYALHHDDRFDVVIVDTPPAHHALALLDAPQRLNRFLSNRIYRTLVRPTKGLGRLAVGAARTLTRRIAAVVGVQILDDALEFFDLFAGMEEGFTSRASAIDALLASDECRFLLVTAADDGPVATCDVLRRELASRSIEVSALVVNLVTPDSWATIAPHEDALRAISPELGLRIDAARRLHETAEAERAVVGGLVEAIGADRVRRIPRFVNEVHDLDGLARAADALSSN